MRKINFSLSIYSVCIFLIFFVGVFLRIFAWHHLSYNVIGDECFSIYGSITPIKDLFVRFIQGTNFLPLYRCLLRIIYEIFGINWPLFKLPSLIASICSIFVFYKILYLIFKNKVLILSALSLFCFNYTLIHFSMRVKPYSIDVLLVLLVLYFSISRFIHKKNFNIKETLQYSFISSVMIFTSLPTIMYIFLSWFAFFIKALKDKSYYFLRNLFVFFLIVCSTFFVEYLTYINKMVGDNDLKRQWLSIDYFFKPDSFSAINSIIHFCFFKFEFYDIEIQYVLPTFILIIFLVLFFVGSIKFLIKDFKLKKQGLLSYFLVFPVFIFVVLSFLEIYPFCNRLIIFLIPVNIICIVNAFNLVDNKYLNNLRTAVMNILLSVFVIFMFGYIFKIGEIKYLLTNEEQYGMVKKELDMIEAINKKDEIIISNEQLCSFCLNNKNILIFSNKNSVNNDEINYFDKRVDQNKKVVSINDMVNNYSKVYFFHNFIDYEGLTNEYILDELKKLNYKEKMNTKEDNGMFVISVMEKEK